MKWLLPLITVSLLSSCTTLPWMVGSVQEQYPLRKKKPGEGWKRSGDIDYSQQGYQDPGPVITTSGK